MSSELPMIMLGLRSTYKEDIKATPVEIVYGKSLRLPADFFITPKILDSSCEFIQKFKRLMSTLYKMNSEIVVTYL